MIIECAEPRAVQPRILLGTRLDTAKKLSQLVLGSLEPHIAGDCDGFVQAQQRKACGVKLIADRIAVLLNQWCLGGSIIFVPKRNTVMPNSVRADVLVNCAGR